MPCHVYCVKATLFCGDDRETKQMPMLTGLMGQTWQAKWIEPEQPNGIAERPIRFFEQFMPLPDHYGGQDRLHPAQEIQKVFQLEHLPKQAVFCASAHGVYCLLLNGQRVDERRLAPETTDYHNQLFYQVYDVARFLKKGENKLTVLVADGWWMGRIGATGDSCQYGDRLGFLGQLTLYDEQGNPSVIATDESFTARPSHIRYADLFMGEKWDLTQTLVDFRPCVFAAFDLSNLQLQPIPSIRPLETVAPASLTTIPNGDVIVDFGRCLAGVIHVRLRCAQPRTVIFEHSEVLDKDGKYFRNILGRNKDQQDVLVCGLGDVSFCPQFTYHGFRYVLMEGIPRTEIQYIEAIVIGTPLNDAGEFSCSDKRLNALHENILNSIRSNMISVPTDCPQREKQGWTGDIQIFAETGCFNKDLHGFLRAWLHQMRRAQRSDGGIPIVIPSYPMQTKMQVQTFGDDGSAAWSDACVLVPLTLYEQYGDIQVLTENLPMMKNWLDYIAHCTQTLPNDYEALDDAAKARCPYLWRQGYHFGDWLIPSFQDDVHGGTKATADVVASCQYAITVEAFIEVLGALEADDTQIAPYVDLLKHIRHAICEEYVSMDGIIAADLQGLYVMVLRAGAVQGELAQKVMDRLLLLIEQNDGCLDTGFVSVSHLLPMLCTYGRKDIAWNVLFQTNSPSWLYQVLNGATAIWENWNAIRPDGTVTASSMNHYALGSVGAWIYEHIGGLQRLSPGWQRVRFAPDVGCGLQQARCSHLSPYGRIVCRWHLQGGALILDVEVPCGVSAEIALPNHHEAVPEGTHNYVIPLA